MVAKVKKPTASVFDTMLRHLGLNATYLRKWEVEQYKADLRERIDYLADELVYGEEGSCDIPEMICEAFDSYLQPTARDKFAVRCGQVTILVDELDDPHHYRSYLIFPNGEVSEETLSVIRGGEREEVAGDILRSWLLDQRNLGDVEKVAGWLEHENNDLVLRYQDEEFYHPMPENYFD